MYHQTEHEEHNQLAQPREAVKERLGLAFTGELIIADDETADINREVSITLQVIRDGENEDTCREDHDGVKGFVAQFDLTHENHQSLSERIAEDGSHHQLDDDRLHNRKCFGGIGQTRKGIGSQHHADERRGEHICHRVVRSGFEFQKGTQVMFESNTVRTEDRKDAGTIRTGHSSRHEQREPDGDGGHGIDPTEDKIDDHTRDDAGDEYAQSSQRDTRRKDGFDVTQFGFETAVKEDDTHRERTEGLRCLGRDLHASVPKDRRYAVRAKEHSHYQKEQQGRYTVLITDLVRKNADEEQER